MNILTFDIEDWWVYEHYSLGQKAEYLPRLNKYLNDILNILEDKQIKATFFCLGKVAESNPEVIKLISSRGHQIGCHSYNHKFMLDLSPDEIKEDTSSAIKILEDISGEKVTVYRAPAFSISEKNKWVFEILIELGITHDCSIFPAHRSFGGFSSFRQSYPSLISYNGLTIKELPISLTKIFSKDIAYSGGGYFRLFPYWKIKSIISKGDYVMTYFHIKDFDRDQKRKLENFHGESAVIRYLKNYYGLDNNFNKFQMLVNDFDFVNVAQADRMIDWENSPNIEI